jgi:hypothetical protein
LFVLIFVLSVGAIAQGTGTIIVMELTDNGFVIAADSLAKSKNSTADYSYCKIGTIDNDAIFAASGATGYYPVAPGDTPAWGYLDQARLASGEVRNLQPTDDVTAAVTTVADNWSRRIEALWSVTIQKHRDEALWIVQQQQYGNTLSHAVFAIGREGHIALSLRSVVLNFDGVHVVTEQASKICSLNAPCATGKTEVFYEFTRKTTVRSSHERPEPTPILQVIRLVDLTIAYDTSGDVGGRVDALELSNGGHVTWHQRKENCH